MITRDELKNIFRLLSKHEDLLISAYLENSGIINDAVQDYDAVDALLRARLLWRPADSEPVRMTRELSSLFERVLRDPRRLAVNADIGGFLINIENSVRYYKAALRSGVRDDISHYMGQIERLVDDLRSSLLDSSGHLWQKINSEFGYVSSLDLKIKENETVLNQAKRLNDGLELIKVNEINELVESDSSLRRYLNCWLLDSVELCRKETVDAIHKLNDLLFESRKQQRLGRLISSFYRRYQKRPGFTPPNYAESGDIPDVLNYAAPMPTTGSPDIYDPRQEIVLIGLISGLRKNAPEAEVPDNAERVEVQSEPQHMELMVDPLKQAVEKFYEDIINADCPLSVVLHKPADNIVNDHALWVYAVISHYSNMDDSERRLFNVRHQETIDPVFNGLHRVHDVTINLVMPSN